MASFLGGFLGAVLIASVWIGGERASEVFSEPMARMQVRVMVRKRPGLEFSPRGLEVALRRDGWSASLCPRLSCFIICQHFTCGRVICPPYRQSLAAVRPGC